MDISNIVKQVENVVNSTNVLHSSSPMIITIKGTKFICYRDFDCSKALDVDRLCNLAFDIEGVEDIGFGRDFIDSYGASFLKYKNALIFELKKDLQITESKVKIFEASGMSEEEKMDAWHNGTRRQNVKGCSDDKLTFYYRICAQKGYEKECGILEAEITARGLKVPRVGNATPNLKTKPDEGLDSTDLGSFAADAKNSNYDAEAMSYNVGIHALNRGFYGLLDSIKDFIEAQGYSEFMKVETSYGSAAVKLDYDGMYQTLLTVYASVNGKQVFFGSDTVKKYGLPSDRVGVTTPAFKKFFYKTCNIIDEVGEKCLEAKKRVDSFKKNDKGEYEITDGYFRKMASSQYVEKAIELAKDIDRFCFRNGIKYVWTDIPRENTKGVFVGSFSNNRTTYDVYIAIDSFADCKYYAKSQTSAYKSYSGGYDVNKKPTGMVRMALA